jgi:acyl-[acyl-carrier-protein]-phospholipid O-acyltransferase / long-chain-fatty-acid--[acyl-carrier-protein] ligase
MIASILRFICKILFRVEVRGLENVPAEDGLLIVANHESFLDGLLLCIFLPKKATFVVHTSTFKKWSFRQALRLTRHVEVDTTNPIAMKKVIKLLEAGENVVVFPEGRVTATGEIQKVYDGPGFIAGKTGATVLPVRIDGAGESYFGRLSRHQLKRLFPRVTLTVLPSTNIVMPKATHRSFPTGKQRRRIAGEGMRSVMQKMLFESQKNRTLFEAFLDAVDKFGGDYKLIEDMNETEETYQNLLKKSLALGRIASKVSSSGEVVGVLMPNITNTLALILGMSAFNRVPAMLNYTSGTAGMQNACIAANVKTIITSHKFIEVAGLESVVENLQNLNVVYLEDLRAQFGVLDRAWLMGYALHYPRSAMETSSHKETAVVLFTSGSEGKPKGVVHSHKSILANISQILSTIEFTSADKFMMVLPVFHSFGFTGSLLPILNGIKINIFPSPLQYKVIPELINNRGCTVFFATSTFLANYAKFAHPNDFSKLRIVVAGAEKLNDEVRKTYQEKFGITILEGYGTTECAPAVSINSPTTNLNGSVGQLVAGLEAKLEAVPGIGNGGLLHVKGENVMLGYYLFDKPGVLNPPAEGWYNTGDIVEIDAQGFIHIRGRVKRFAKVAGEMVSLEVVEHIANTAAPEQQHAASSVADAQRGESIMLFTTDKKLKREDLQIVAKNLGLPELAVARKIIALEEIPLLGTGKTDYVTLKQMAEAA